MPNNYYLLTPYVLPCMIYQFFADAHTHLDSIQLSVGIIESIFTTLAIIAGLWWFLRRRERSPKANMHHQVDFIKVNDGLIYVGVSVIVENVGKVPIVPTVADTQGSVVTIEEIAPYLQSSRESQDESPEYKLKPLGLRTFPAKMPIEAGERQTILFDFIIHKSTKAIKVYSYIINGQSENSDPNQIMGWNNTTVHEVTL